MLSCISVRKASVERTPSFLNRFVTCWITGERCGMKVVLSRKGFDSANGGIPSPIMPDGEMLSFPISSWSEKMLSDLRFGRESYADIYSDLAGYRCDLSCHVDPDLASCRHRKTPKGWAPAFGQANSALGYLNDTVGVEPGDLFLFFGWFHAVERIGGMYQYVRDSGDFFRDCDLHVIWGYMPNAIVNQRKNSAKGAGVYYSGIWQELALKETKRAEQWAMDMILNKPTRRMR